MDSVWSPFSVTLSIVLCSPSMYHLFTVKSFAIGAIAKCRLCYSYMYVILYLACALWDYIIYELRFICHVT